MEKVCSVDGCGCELVAQGLCRKHYMRLRRKGTLDDRRKNARPVCVVEGCERGATAYGYCHNHKGRSEQYGNRRQALLLAKREGRTCFQCGGPVPIERPSDAIYCSRECNMLQRRADGRQREASLKSYFKTRYGLTPERVEEMADKGCAICGTADWPGRHSRPHVDHDHKTGVVRGVLCSECNYGLGKFKDDPDLLRKAAAYLER